MNTFTIVYCTLQWAWPVSSVFAWWMDIRRVIRTDRWLCPHCDQLLSAKTHDFDRSSNSWITKQSLERAKDVCKDNGRSVLVAIPATNQVRKILPLPMSFHTAVQESPLMTTAVCHWIQIHILEMIRGPYQCQLMANGIVMYIVSHCLP